MAVENDRFFSLKGMLDVECNTNFKFLNGEKQITAGQRKNHPKNLKKQN
jgi:hypothetical protein